MQTLNERDTEKGIILKKREGDRFRREGGRRWRPGNWEKGLKSFRGLRGFQTSFTNITLLGFIA